MPLQDEERLFLEAIRDLNHQASMLQSGKSSAAELETAVRPTPTTSSSADRLPHGMVPAAEKLSTPVQQRVTTERLSMLADSASRSTGSGRSGEGDRGGTSFNPYHGPDFMTAIPDQSTPYISSMCVVDPSDRLDAATSLVVDAAMRLNNTSSRPNLHSVMAWVNSRTGGAHQATSRTDASPKQNSLGKTTLAGSRGELINKDSFGSSTLTAAQLKANSSAAPQLGSSVLPSKIVTTHLSSGEQPLGIAADTQSGQKRPLAQFAQHQPYQQPQSCLGQQVLVAQSGEEQGAKMRKL